MADIIDLVRELPAALGGLPWWAWFAAFAMIFGGFLLPSEAD